MSSTAAAEAGYDCDSHLGATFWLVDCCLAGAVLLGGDMHNLKYCIRWCLCSVEVFVRYSKEFRCCAQRILAEGACFGYCCWYQNMALGRCCTDSVQ